MIEELLKQYEGKVIKLSIYESTQQAVLLTSLQFQLCPLWEGHIINKIIRNCILNN